jgi:hypothetical protein
MATRQISLKHAITQAILKEYVHYDPETGIFTWIKIPPHNNVCTIGGRLGWIHRKGYREIRVCGVTLKAHQAAWLYMTGEWPADIIDHRDQVKDNNIWTNLRACTNAENCRNIRKPKRNTSGVLGVGWNKRHMKWTASIRFERRLIHLGWFDEKEDAAIARRAGEIKYFGEFAPNA